MVFIAAGLFLMMGTCGVALVCLVAWLVRDIRTAIRQRSLDDFAFNAAFLVMIVSFVLIGIGALTGAHA